jgi:UDP-N-acetyl-D-glucosamine dehydrogenase
MPEHVVSRIADILNDHDHPVRGSKILAVGIAYKPNVADDRESPALAVLQLLEARGADITVLDPLVAPDAVLRRGFTHVANDRTENLSGFDLVVVLTDHDAVDYQAIVSSAPAIFDTRNAFRRRGITSATIEVL